MSNPQKHWKEQYEDAGTAEKERYVQTSVEHLLQAVQRGQFGDYHQIWYALAENATLEQAGWTLYHVLASPIDYLHRYHAAAALIQLLGKAGVSSGFEPVQLSGNPIFIRDNLPKVREMLVQKLGEDPAPPAPPTPPAPRKKWYEKIFSKKSS